eukprot:m.19200 g.19200  ORF g.19200 m.19200 type:complete len:301 (-) comp11731_c0_seq1:99-1001(-)
MAEYIFICCGASQYQGHFSETLMQALVREGNTVVIGATGNHFGEVRKAIAGCDVFVVVITEKDDQVFLQRMLQEAGELKKPTIMVPYHVASMSEGGFGYTAHSASNAKTVCFTDWIGHGMQIESPIFQSIFAQFMSELDTVQGGAKSPKPQSLSFHNIVELVQYSHRYPDTSNKLATPQSPASPGLVLASVPRRAKKTTQHQGHAKLPEKSIRANDVGGRKTSGGKHGIGRIAPTDANAPHEQRKTRGNPRRRREHLGDDHHMEALNSGTSSSKQDHDWKRLPSKNTLDARPQSKACCIS